MYRLMEISEMFDIPERTLRRHLKLGWIHGVKTGGTWRFSEEDVSRYLADERMIQNQQNIQLREIFDFLNGFSKGDNQIVFIRQFRKTTLSENKAIANLIKEVRSDSFFHLERKSDRTIITFRGADVDATELIRKIQEILK